MLLQSGLVFYFLSIICSTCNARFILLTLKAVDENIRIVGGEDVDISEVPYQVSLHYNGHFICGGSIIAPNVILSAAHCLVIGESEKFTVRAGSTLNYTGGVVVKVKDRVVHEKYNPETLDSDVGLLWLEEKLIYGDTVQEIKLADSGDELKVGAETLVTGWGKLAEDGQLPLESLQKVIVPVINKESCQDNYPEKTITDTMLCAGYTEGEKDACQGDSGGPLAHSKVQHGIVSWGFGCARPNRPGVYTKVSAVRKWIDAKIKLMKL